MSRCLAFTQSSGYHSQCSKQASVGSYCGHHQHVHYDKIQSQDLVPYRDEMNESYRSLTGTTRKAKIRVLTDDDEPFDNQQFKPIPFQSNSFDQHGSKGPYGSSSNPIVIIDKTVQSNSQPVVIMTNVDSIWRHLNQGTQPASKKTSDDDYYNKCHKVLKKAQERRHANFWQNRHTWRQQMKTTCFIPTVPLLPAP